jgi:hypothetical protein
MTNAYCDVLGIPVPALEGVAGHPEANTYSLLIAALLERGGPMTLADVARRFEQAGIAFADEALVSLSRCRPARPPVYREGDLYALDPYDDEADLWAFRLGLRPPEASRPPEPPAPVPLPAPEVPLTVAELEEAWRGDRLHSWSAQRIALCVLDAHGRAMDPTDLGAFVEARSEASASVLARRTALPWPRDAAVRTLEDGRWALAPDHPWVRSARVAVRERLALVRRWAAQRSDPAVVEEGLREADVRRAARAEELARLRHVLVHAFPADRPELVVVLDVAARELETHGAEALGRVRERLADYDVIAALDVRPLLRTLGFEPGARRLAELGPPQKSKGLNRRGRTLKITTPLLVWGSCGIGRPFGDVKRLRAHRTAGETTKLRRRLEADAKALAAYYAYGRLHHWVRLRWGFLDERIGVPWVQRDETSLYDLKREAQASGRSLEIVAGSAPGWENPWARARLCRVVPEGKYDLALLDDEDFRVDDADVKLARLAIDPSAAREKRAATVLPFPQGPWTGRDPGGGPAE